jgi:alpha-methylacyl-CoA racemase
MTGPLSGFRVIELAGIGPVPFAGAMLADMGADVVRVERPIIQNVTASLKGNPFDFYNRNKRSVALDLKQSHDLKILVKMVERADVLIEGFRPGVTERLGIGPKECLDANQKLIYGRMTGWGQSGPLSLEAGHDINYLAITGALHAIGEYGGKPVPPLNLVADLGGGAMYLVMGILAASMNARKSGKGQIVDAAMIDGVTNLMSAFQSLRQEGFWEDKRCQNIVDGGAPYYGCYETQDQKYIAVGAMEPKFYASLLEILGLKNKILTEQNDRHGWSELRNRFGEIFLTKKRDDWIKLAAGRDSCISPVLSMDEATEHPHMKVRNVYLTFDSLRHPSPAPRFSQTPSSVRRSAPAPGEHNLEVFNDWELNKPRI